MERIFANPVDRSASKPRRLLESLVTYNKTQVSFEESVSKKDANITNIINEFQILTSVRTSKMKTRQHGESIYNINIE